MLSDGEPRNVSTLPVQLTFLGSVSPKVDSQLCWAPIKIPQLVSERAAQPATKHRSTDPARLGLIPFLAMFAIIHDTRTYRYLRARYARAAPTAMPRASHAISLATRWRFKSAPLFSYAGRYTLSGYPGPYSKLGLSNTPSGLARYAIISTVEGLAPSMPDHLLRDLIAETMVVVPLLGFSRSCTIASCGYARIPSNR